MNQQPNKTRQPEQSFPLSHVSLEIYWTHAVSALPTLQSSWESAHSRRPVVSLWSNLSYSLRNSLIHPTLNTEYRMLSPHIIHFQQFYCSIITDHKITHFKFIVQCVLVNLYSCPAIHANWFRNISFTLKSFLMATAVSLHSPGPSAPDNHSSDLLSLERVLQFLETPCKWDHTTCNLTCLALSLWEHVPAVHCLEYTAF